MGVAIRVSRQRIIPEIVVIVVLQVFGDFQLGDFCVVREQFELSSVDCESVVGK